MSGALATAKAIGTAIEDLVADDLCGLELALDEDAHHDAVVSELLCPSLVEATVPVVFAGIPLVEVGTRVEIKACVRRDDHDRRGRWLLKGRDDGQHAALLTVPTVIVMRIEATNGNEHKVWLTDSEIEELRRATTSQRDDLVIQLGAFVGLRAFEIPQVRPVDVNTTESGQYRLRVDSGKDTSGNGGKPRDAYLPYGVERDLQRYQNEHNIAPQDPFIDLKQPGVRAVVRRTAARAAEATGDDFAERTKEAHEELNESLERRTE